MPTEPCKQCGHLCNNDEGCFLDLCANTTLKDLADRVSAIEISGCAAGQEPLARVTVTIPLKGQGALLERWLSLALKTPLGGRR